MRKLLLLLLIISLYFTANAQRYGRKFDDDVYPTTFSVVGGATIASLKTTSPNAADPFQNIKSTISFGVNVDFRMSDNFSIRPGVMYAGKGGAAAGYYVNGLGATSMVNNDYDLNYLEVPLNLLAHIPVSDNGSIYFGGGPFIAYGLNGKNNQNFGSDSQKQNVYFGANGDFNKNDYGATAVLGFQANNGLSISANGDIGLKNILLNNNSGYNLTGVKTFFLYLTVGQSF